MSDITAHHGIFRDTKLHVDDYGGGGHPVVLIHGWPLSGESFKYNVPALRDAGYRVITYDRRGFGRSDKPRSGYEYDTLADDLHALLMALDLSDVTLVGFSMGGGEVARYASRHGNERVSSAMFASAVPPYLSNTDDNPEGPLTKQMVADQTTQLTADPRWFYSSFLMDFFSVGEHPEGLRYPAAGGDGALPAGRQAGLARLHGRVLIDGLPPGPPAHNGAGAGTARRRGQGGAPRRLRHAHP